MWANGKQKEAKPLLKLRVYVLFASLTLGNLQREPVMAQPGTSY